MSIENAKAMLPNIPDEIFKIWLSALIEDIGWQFKQLTDSPIGTPWASVLGVELTLDMFAKLLWKKNVLTMNDCDFTNPLKEALKRFIRKGSKLEDSESRIRWHKSWIISEGRLFAPIILIRTLAGLDMLDGFHRMTAAILSKNPDIKIDAWIGE